jgi:hypothetical protein
MKTNNYIVLQSIDLMKSSTKNNEKLLYVILMYKYIIFYDKNKKVKYLQVPH